eukprot:scaffold219017_cov35-Tisochrysis_lutea.AAC.2
MPQIHTPMHPFKTPSIADPRLPIKLPTKQEPYSTGGAAAPSGPGQKARMRAARGACPVSV